MVMLYVGGKPIGTWAEAERLFAEAARSQAVEFRDEAGRVIATTVPPAGPDPDWVAAITPAEVERRRAEPGFTFDEVKKRLGWE